MSAGLNWIYLTVVNAAESAGHAAEGAGHGAAVPLPPDIITIIHDNFAGNNFVDLLYRWEYQIYALTAIFFVFLFFRAASRGAGVRPTRMQAAAELLLDGLKNLIVGILGEKEAKRYFPFLATLFIFILFMNLQGLIPLLKAPTSNIKITGALAICVFLYVQFTAITRLGPVKFVYHLMGEPRDAIGWAMVPLFLPLHIMEELIKPLSLACRLYGNVYGKEILLGVCILLGVQLAMAIVPSTFVGIPLHFPFMFLAILLSAIQALIFMLLSTVYISLVLPHEEH